MRSPARHPRQSSPAGRDAGTACAPTPAFGAIRK
jgi:hypothetical protein